MSTRDNHNYGAPVKTRIWPRVYATKRPMLSIAILFLCSLCSARNITMISVTQSTNAAAPSIFNTFLDPSGSRFLTSGRITPVEYKQAILDSLEWATMFKYDFRHIQSNNGVITKGSAIFFPYSISYTVTSDSDYPKGDNTERCVEYGFAVTDGNKLIVISALSFTNSSGVIGKLLPSYSWYAGTKDNVELVVTTTVSGILQVGSMSCGFLYGAGLVAVNCKIQLPYTPYTP